MNALTNSFKNYRQNYWYGRLLHRNQRLQDKEIKHVNARRYVADINILNQFSERKNTQNEQLAIYKNLMDKSFSGLKKYMSFRPKNVVLSRYINTNPYCKVVEPEKL